MATGFPVKANYATGDVLTAANMNDLAGTLNYLDPTAKGDLFPASDGSTLTRLAVGADNTLLTADSTQTTGIKWGGAWTTWTPTFTNLTVGNGSYTARYCQIGKTVFVEFKFTMGSTSSMGTIPQISVPVSAALTPGSFTCFLEDSGVKAYYGYVDISAGKFYPTVGVTNSTYMIIDYVQPTVPFTWGTNDSLSFRAVYEAA